MGEQLGEIIKKRRLVATIINIFGQFMISFATLTVNPSVILKGTFKNLQIMPLSLCSLNSIDLMHNSFIDFISTATQLVHINVPARLKII